MEVPQEPRGICVNLIKTSTFKLASSALAQSDRLKTAPGTTPVRSRHLS